MTNASTSPLEIEVEAIPEVDLSEIDASVKNGRLVLANLMEYMKARKAIAQTSPQELVAWSEALGYESMASAFDDWMNSLTDDASALKVPVPRYAYELDEGMYIPNSYSGILSMIANKNGQFVIGDDIHAVTYDDHINVADATEELLAEALSNRVTDTLKGIYVDNIDRINYSTSRDIQKTVTDVRICPRLSANSSGQTIHLYNDEKESRRRLTFNLLLTTTHEFNNGSIRSIAYNTEASFRNNMKQGFIWKNIYVDTRMQEVDDRSLLMVRRLRLLRFIDPCPFVLCRENHEQVWLDGPIDEAGRVYAYDGVHFRAEDIDSGLFTPSDVDDLVDYRYAWQQRMRYDFSRGRYEAFWEHDEEPDLHVILGCQ